MINIPTKTLKRLIYNKLKNGKDTIIKNEYKE